MDEFSLSQLNRRAGELADKAMISPILLRKHGRPQLVLMSFDQYQTLIGHTSQTDVRPDGERKERVARSGLAALTSIEWAESEVPDEF